MKQSGKFIVQHGEEYSDAGSITFTVEWRKLSLPQRARLNSVIEATAKALEEVAEESPAQPEPAPAG